MVLRARASVCSFVCMLNVYKSVHTCVCILLCVRGACYVHVYVRVCRYAFVLPHTREWHYTVFHCGQCDAPTTADLHIKYKVVCAAMHAFNVWACVHGLTVFTGKQVIIYTDSTATK